jgi:hypothetical protein
MVWLANYNEPIESILEKHVGLMMQKEEILKYAGYPKSYAASLLNVTMSDLTKMCQDHGIKLKWKWRSIGIVRWPYHPNKVVKKHDNSPFSQFVLECKTTKPSGVQKQKKMEKPQDGTEKEKILEEITKDLVVLPSFKEFLGQLNNRPQ